MGKLFLNILFGLMPLIHFMYNGTSLLKYCAVAIAEKPVVLTWEMLFKVVLVEKYSTKYKTKINVPEFDYTLQKLDKKEVTISGFVIPTVINSNNFVLSQNPYASCYFCGNGGPETVMTIKYKGRPPKYKTDDFITLKGIFQLNNTDVNELIYVLNNAVQVK